MACRSPALTSLPWNDGLAAILEQTSAAIGRLDARNSATPVGAAWQLRAAWTGYAKALQLQGHEIDEIDVYAWGCALPLPGRARLSTIHDPFEPFAKWQAQFAGNAKRHWREDLGARVEPDPSYGGPRLIRSLEALRQISIAENSIHAWLAMPLLLQRIGVTHSLLPCLVAGEKRLRFNQPADEAVLRRLLKGLHEGATTGLERLDGIERDRLRSMRVIADAARPGALTRLAVRLQGRPIASPQQIAREFRITIGGAGKLLARAQANGLVREVRGKQAWKLYMVPDLAIVFGFVGPARGRPRAEPPTLPR